MYLFVIYPKRVVAWPRDARAVVPASLPVHTFAETVVRPFPDVENGKALISRSEFVSDPLWSPDGREIFYLSELRMMSVQVRTEPTFSHGTPEPLFGGLYQCCVGMSYDVAADGRFLMLKYTADFSTATFVQDWTEELKRL